MMYRDVVSKVLEESFPKLDPFGSDESDGWATHATRNDPFEGTEFVMLPPAFTKGCCWG